MFDAGVIISFISNWAFLYGIHAIKIEQELESDEIKVFIENNPFFIIFNLQTERWMIFHQEKYKSKSIIDNNKTFFSSEQVNSVHLDELMNEGIIPGILECDVPDRKYETFKDTISQMLPMWKS